VGGFVIFCLLHKFATRFFQSALGFCPAQVVFRRRFVFQSSFSSGDEVAASVVALVFK